MAYEPEQRAGERERSEVDSTESLWYSRFGQQRGFQLVLKLTPPSHYGILL